MFNINKDFIDNPNANIPNWSDFYKLQQYVLFMVQFFYISKRLLIVIVLLSKASIEILDIINSLIESKFLMKSVLKSETFTKVQIEIV